MCELSMPYRMSVQAMFCFLNCSCTELTDFLLILRVDTDQHVLYLVVLFFSIENTRLVTF